MKFLIDALTLGERGEGSLGIFVALTTMLVCPATKSRVSSLVLLVWFCLLLGVLYLKDTVCVKSEIPTEENVIDGIFLAPAIVAGVVTLGVMQQIIRAFGRVEGSMQYLLKAWPTIIELASVYKRLREFESVINSTEIVIQKD